MIFLLFMVSWKVTITMIIITIIIILPLSKIVSSYSLEVGANKKMYAEMIGNQASESILGIKNVKILSLEDRISNSFNESIKKYVQTLVSFRVNSSLPQIIGEICLVSLFLAAIFLTLKYTENSLKSLIPIIALFIVVGNRITVQIGLISNSIMHVMSNMISLQHVHNLINESSVIEDLDKGKNFEAVKGDIVFKNVSFSYTNGQKVFSDFNFTIPNGKFISLIGDSGSGKSTLIEFLLGLKVPQSGSIKIGNININEFSLKSLRSSIGYVSQEVLLFNKSVMENIVDGNCNAKIQDVEQICKMVYAHDFIDKLPLKYKSNVGDRGTKISGGQKQRLAIARMLISNPDILILDEATSAMDEELESKIINKIKEYSSGKTVIFITHRIAATKNSDFIFKLVNGEILQLDLK